MPIATVRQLKKPEPLTESSSVPPSFALATWLASRAPDWLFYLAAQLGGGVHYLMAPQKRRAYTANTRGFARFEPGQGPWTAFQNQALNVLELLRASRETPDDLLSRFTLHGREHIERALDRGKGLVLTTFHSGNWELCGLGLALAGFPVTTVAGEQLRPGWSEAVKMLKRRTGIKVLSPNHSMRQLFRDLESNRVVALHIDGDRFSGGTPIGFLGKTINAPVGPARLSRVVGAPVAVAYCRRHDRSRLHLHVESPHEPPVSRDAESRLTAKLMARVENRIVDDPAQWCIFRRL